MSLGRTETKITSLIISKLYQTICIHLGAIYFLNNFLIFIKNKL